MKGICRRLNPEEQFLCFASFRSASLIPSRLGLGHVGSVTPWFVRHAGSVTPWFVRHAGSVTPWFVRCAGSIFFKLKISKDTSLTIMKLPK